MILRRPSTELVAAFGAYMLFGALVAIAFSAARAAGDWALNFESGAVRLLTLAAAAGLVCSIVLLAFSYRASRPDRKNGFWLPVMMSVLVVGFFLTVAEIGLRVVAQPDALGRRIGSTILLPYEWPVAARTNLELAGERSSEDSYLVEDRALGWSIGASRSSEDGLYYSSTEGLRSDVIGRSYSKGDLNTPIALMGDSFAFSEEVPYEQSLASHLEQRLPENQILNFGVPGYGIDQAVLRFEQQAVAWAPKIAVLAFIDDDLFRTKNVYVFLKAWGIPFSKPRFMLSAGDLDVLNAPTLTPEEMFSKDSVFDLPWIDQDIEFTAHRWATHPLHASYLMRFLVSKIPVWPTSARITGQDSIVSLSVSVIERFIRSATDASIVPVVVYLPTSGDFRGGSRAVKEGVMEKTLAAGLPVHDLSRCVSDQAEDQEIFMPGGHYSDTGNAIVADCLVPILVGAGLDKLSQ